MSASSTKRIKSLVREETSQEGAEQSDGDKKFREAIRTAEDKAKKHREKVRSLSGAPAKAGLDDLAKDETARLLEQEYVQISKDYPDPIKRVGEMLTPINHKIES